jgi:hypothetical protein
MCASEFCAEPKQVDSALCATCEAEEVEALRSLLLGTCRLVPSDEFSAFVDQRFENYA